MEKCLVWSIDIYMWILCQEKVRQRFVCPTKIQYWTVTEYNLVKIIKTKCYIKGSESHRTYGNYIISHVSSEYQ